MIVRAPLKLPKAEIDRFIQLKSGWISRKLFESQAKAEQRGSFRLNYGDIILYRGKPYPITAKPGNRAGFDGDSFWIPPDLPPDQIMSACIQVYRLYARHVMNEKVMTYAKRMDAMPTSVKINGAKTRWGSCSAQKSLNFSWRLIMADDAVIDYVVVHELAHIIHMNHSERFWSAVENVLPDYKMRQVELKKLQRRLSTENWDL